MATENDEYHQMINDYVKITEMVGEAAWGIGLPSPMKVTFCQPLNPFLDPEDQEKPEIKHVAVRPESYQPIFEAIYQKMKASGKYAPYLKIKKDYETLERKHEKLLDALVILIDDIKSGSDA